MKKVNEEKIFEYLDELRASGLVNMFGAGSYVAQKVRTDGRRGTYGGQQMDAHLR